MNEFSILQGLADATTIATGQRLGIDAKQIASMGSSRDIQKLLNYFPNLPIGVQEANKNGTAITYGHEIFAVTRPTITDYFTLPSNVKTAGQTNIDNGKLASGEYFLATGMKLLFNLDTATSYGAMSYANLFNTIIPVDMFSATIELRKNEKTVLAGLPLAVFQSQVYGYGVEKPLGYYELSNPKFWAENEKMDAKLNDKPALSGGGTVFSGWTYFALCGTMIKV